MYYPYCTLPDKTEVVHTPYRKGYTVVHFEKPDPIYCFKTLDCVIPGYQVSSIVGFDNDEVAALVEFCRHNAHLLLEYSKVKGGIANA